ncbi:MAG: SusD/RagB family nutrient-binding outer membrane lipoprotein [Hymenobacter sp.]|nr:MAG: SusD/RagB family nutrient-binding outer membrane lipoprotein [Hymenobacter sp.]
MKAYLKLFAVAALTTASSGCSSFLDINTNPNSLTTVTPDAILAQALAVTAGNYTGNAPSYNSYASWAAGYWGKTGVVSGYGEEITYNYSNSYYSGLFNNTYDNLNDYQLIINQGATTYPNHAAIARIMKAYNYLLLVDEWGDIPYTDALKGAGNTTPKYDSAASIYLDLITQLTGAISDINAAAAVSTSRTVGGEDIVFGGNMVRWKRFANSLKLRILLRESQTGNATLNAYVATQMAALQTAADGFILTDVVAQPGYAQNAGQQNPFYNRYGYTPAGNSATERQYQIPTQYILNQYLNNNDPRLTQYYVIGARGATGAQVPEWIGARPGEASSPSFNAPLVASRFLGSNTGTAATAPAGGFFKGLNAPTIIMHLSEHLFSKAEAETRNLITNGNAADDYQNGLVAAFQTAYRTGNTTPAAVPADPTTSTATGLTQYRTYIAANTANPLVNFAIATSNGLGKQPIIIYQKYLAMNTLGSVEAWDDYRRTGLPALSAGGPGLPVSIQSSSPRADRLPTRLIYPITETTTNGANLPTGTTQFTKIFWDVVD